MFVAEAIRGCRETAAPAGVLAAPVLKAKMVLARPQLAPVALALGSREVPRASVRLHQRGEFAVSFEEPSRETARHERPARERERDREREVGARDVLRARRHPLRHEVVARVVGADQPRAHPIDGDEQRRERVSRGVDGESGGEKRRPDVIAVVAEGGEDEGDDAVRPPQDVDEAAEQHGHADHERLEAVGVLVAEATEEPADVGVGREGGEQEVDMGRPLAVLLPRPPKDAFRNHAHGHIHGRVVPSRGGGGGRGGGDDREGRVRGGLRRERGRERPARARDAAVRDDRRR